MFSLIIAFFALTAVMIFGVLLVQMILPKTQLLEQMALGYLIGFGLFTFVLFILNLVRVPYAALPATIILLVLLGLCALTIQITQHPNWKQLWREKKNSLPKIKRLTSDEKVLLAFLVTLTSITLIISAYWPVKDWDSIVLYDFRAKTFVETGYMDAGISLGYFFGYPLFTSLAHAWLYMFDYPYPGIIHSLLYTTFLILVYYAFRRQTSRIWALLWTAVMGLSSGLFDHALITYTNLAYTVFLVGSYIYLFDWLRNNRRNVLIISALMLGLSTWSRSAEPFWLVPMVIVVATSFYKRDWKSLFIYPAITLAIRQPWQMYEKAHARSQEGVVSTAATVVGEAIHKNSLKLFFDVATYYWVNVIYPNKLLYAIFALLLVMIAVRIKEKRARRRDVVILAVITLNIVGVFAGIYYYSIFYKEWQNIGGSAQRMSLFFGPLIIYFAAMATYQLFIDSSNKSRK